MFGKEECIDHYVAQFKVFSYVLELFFATLQKFVFFTLLSFWGMSGGMPLMVRHRTQSQLFRYFQLGTLVRFTQYGN